VVLKRDDARGAQARGYRRQDGGVLLARSSTNLILLQLIQQAKVTPKMVATGGAPGTFSANGT
jgi:hypothetical protein